MATTLFLLLDKLFATAIPKLEDIEVELWAAPYVSYSLSDLLVKPERPLPCLIVLISFFLPGFYGEIIPFFLFVLASFTDFLDGLLARLYKEESKLGELLDPIADKILVATALILLVMNNTINNESSNIYSSPLHTIAGDRNAWKGPKTPSNKQNSKADWWNPNTNESDKHHRLCFKRSRNCKVENRFRWFENSH